MHSRMVSQFYTLIFRIHASQHVIDILNHVDTNHTQYTPAYLMHASLNSQLYVLSAWPCGLMDKALVFGTKDCRFESCQGHIYDN